MNLPFSGRWHRASEKKFDVTVLFVPFFGAHNQALQRHCDFVNELGFDCVTFELKDRFREMPTSLVSGDLQFGLKKIWTDQIEKMLNEIPGKKIIFAFSNPSASAIEATVRRNCVDVVGLVCDGGPTGDFLSSLYSYFEYEQPLQTTFLRAGAALASALVWHPRFTKVLHEDLIKLPKGFKILSVRGWKDKLITPSQIDKVFEPHSHLDWQKLSLPQAGHLNGLKDFPEEYKPTVGAYLKALA